MVSGSSFIPARSCPASARPSCGPKTTRMRCRTSDWCILTGGLSAGRLWCRAWRASKLRADSHHQKVLTERGPGGGRIALIVAKRTAEEQVAVSHVFEPCTCGEDIFGAGDTLETVVFVARVEVEQEVAQEFVVGIG